MSGANTDNNRDTSIARSIAEHNSFRYESRVCREMDVFTQGVKILNRRHSMGKLAGETERMRKKGENKRVEVNTRGR